MALNKSNVLYGKGNIFLHKQVKVLFKRFTSVQKINIGQANEFDLNFLPSNILPLLH